MLNKMWLCTQIWGSFISANINGFQWPELRPCNRCPLSRFLRRRKLRNSFQRFHSPHRNLRGFSRRWIYGERRSAGIVTVISRFLDVLAQDTHYKYFFMLVIPMSIYFVIANWVGWQYY